jgi:hypothetical protein
MGKKRMQRQKNFEEMPLIRACDFGTPELACRENLIKELVGKQTERMRNINNTWPLDRYFTRGTINEAEYHAGKRIYSDFDRGRVTSFCSNWPDPARPIGTGGSGGGMRLSEVQADCLSGFRNAYRSLNNEGAFLVWHVVCLGVDVSIYEQASRWRAGFGMIRLREALDDLSYFYRKKR